MTSDDVARVLERELAAVQREIALFRDDTLVWRTAPATPNSAGNLALHIAGSIQHFIGASLGEPATCATATPSSTDAPGHARICSPSSTGPSPWSVKCCPPSPPMRSRKKSPSVAFRRCRGNAFSFTSAFTPDTTWARSTTRDEH